jgi:hypothetical protein
MPLDARRTPELDTGHSGKHMHGDAQIDRNIVLEAGQGRCISGKHSILLDRAESLRLSLRMQ